MAAAIPFVPMIIGAGAGAMIDKQNPLRGAMLGAAGGSIAGPAVAGLTGAGSAAAASAGAAGAVPGTAASYGAAGAGLFGPQQAAMLAEQTGVFGAPGLSSTLQSAGMSAPMAKLSAIGTMGPQGLFGAMSGKDMAMMGGRMLGSMQQPQQAPPMASPAPPPRQAMPPQPMNPMLSGRIIRPQRKY